MYVIKTRSVFGNTGATALAVQKEFMFENSFVFTFVAKHYGIRYVSVVIPFC